MKKQGMKTSIAQYIKYQILNIYVFIRMVLTFEQSRRQNWTEPHASFQGEKEHYSVQVTTIRAVCIENKLQYLLHKLFSFTSNKAALSAEI